MLTAIREGSKGWIASIIIGLIVITFALFGISSYLEGGEEIPVATVNGEEIEYYTYQNQLNQQRQALLSRFGGDFDPALLDTLGVKDRVLDGLIESQLLASYVADRNYRVSDAQLAERIQNNPMFQTDGQFDAQRYANIIESSRMTPPAYEASERQAAVIGQLEEAVAGSAFILDAELDRLITLQNQRREVSYAVFPANLFVDEFEISDTDARAEYDNNLDRYQSPARMRVDYIDLSIAALAEGIEPTEDDINQTYERLKGRFLTPEVRKASHILFQINADADDAARTAAREKAEATLAELEGGAEFAELAEERSDDTGSAINGGDLGVVARGQMVKPFEDAVYDLEEGAISDIVETQFGFHIIKLTELAEGEQKTLEEVRDEVANEARTALAEATFADLVEPLQNLTFEQPDSLAPAADEIGVEVQTSDWFTLNEGTPGVDDLTQQGMVRRAAFSEDVLEEELNSTAIEIGFDRVIAVRKADYEPEAPRPFEEVKAEIVENLKLERSQQKVQAVAESSLEGLTHAASFDIMVANNELTERQLAPTRAGIEPQNAAVAEAAYAAAPPTDGPVFGRVPLANGDVAVYALTGVEAGQPEQVAEAEREQLAQTLESRDSFGTFRQLMNYLRANAEVTVDREQL